MQKKKWIFHLVAVLGVIFLFISCEYDGPTAQYSLYEDNSRYAPTPVITGIDPADRAVSGKHTLTILGNNFSEASNLVYFDDKRCEVIENTETAITIRRPALYDTISSIKVAAAGALNFGVYDSVHHVNTTYWAYIIDSTYSSFGGFDGQEVDAISFDGDGNAYVASDRDLYKVEPNGNKSIVSAEDLEGDPYDARIGPGGNYYYFISNARIIEYNFDAGDNIRRVNKSGADFETGDFDENGNLYAGGEDIDLTVLLPDFSIVSTGLYADIDTSTNDTDFIHCIRVYDGYVYVLATLVLENPTNAIWKHEILDASGSLGPRELVKDLTTFKDGYHNQTFYCFTFGSDGMMYIGTGPAGTTSNPLSPVLIYNPSDDSQDVLLKGILPSPAISLVWGNGNDLYLLNGTETGVQKIDMGTLTGADNPARGL